MAPGDRPSDGADGERAGDPGSDRRRDGDRERAPLRRHHIGHAENAGRRMGREAGHGAVGDEGGAVIDREQDIGRPGPDRQRHHHGADQRAGAFGDERRGDHERRRDRHLDREHEKEPEVGRHWLECCTPGEEGFLLPMHPAIYVRAHMHRRSALSFAPRLRGGLGWGLPQPRTVLVRKAPPRPSPETGREIELTARAAAAGE